MLLHRPQKTKRPSDCSPLHSSRSVNTQELLMYGQELEEETEKNLVQTAVE